MFFRLPAYVVTLLTEGARPIFSGPPVSHLPGAAASSHTLQNILLAEALVELWFLRGVFQGIPEETCTYDSDLGWQALVHLDSGHHSKQLVAAQTGFSFPFWFVWHSYSSSSYQSCWCVSEISVFRNSLFSLCTTIRLFSHQCIKALDKYITIL